MMIPVIVLLTALICAAGGTAFAYVGPGAGLSLLGAFWGLLAAVLAALMFVVLWPFRRWMKKNRSEHTAEAGGDGEGASPGDRPEQPGR